MHVFAFNYYCLDNILWAMKVGLLTNIRTTRKGFKDSRFSTDDIRYMKQERNYQSLYRLTLAIMLDLVLIAREVKRWYREQRHAKKHEDRRIRIRKASECAEGGASSEPVLSEPILTEPHVFAQP
jgi:hypothetical protein